MKTFRFRKTTTSEIASKIMSVKRRKGRYELKLENGKTYFLPQETLPKDVVPAYGDIFALGFWMDMITIIRLNDRIVFELTPEQLVEKLENNCKLLANIIRKQEEKAIRCKIKLKSENCRPCCNCGSRKRVWHTSARMRKKNFAWLKPAKKRLPCTGIFKI